MAYDPIRNTTLGENGMAETEIEATCPLQGLTPPSSELSPLETLPYDVLYEIARYAFAEDHFHFPLHLSHTSYTLRMFTLAMPNLWSHISFTDPRPKPTAFEEQRTWLDRSEKSPLHIVIRPKNSELVGWPKYNFTMRTLAAIIKLLLPHVGRWRSFCVHCIGELKAYRAVFDPLVGVHAPELVDLVADIPSDKSRWRFNAFRDGAPKLQCVEVDQPSSVLLGGGWDGWTSLRRFVSKGSYWANDPRSLVSSIRILKLIRTNPSLEELVVEGCSFNLPQSPGTVEYRVEAPNLRCLHIKQSPRDQSDVQLSILAAVYAPNLVAMEPWLVVTEKLVASVHPLAVFPWPKLRYIEVDVSGTSSPQITSFLLKFSLIETLYLTWTANVEPLVRLLAAALPSMVNLQVNLRCAADVQHVRDIVAARIGDPSLAPLAQLRVNAGALWVQDTSPGAEGLRETYTWEVYLWFQERVKDFYSSMTPKREEPPETTDYSSIQEQGWRGRRWGQGDTPMPRRRYRKARQTRRAKKEAHWLAVEPEFQPESESVDAGLN